MIYKTISLMLSLSKHEWAPRTAGLERPSAAVYALGFLLPSSRGEPQ